MTTGPTEPIKIVPLRDDWWRTNYNVEGSLHCWEACVGDGVRATLHFTYTAHLKTLHLTKKGKVIELRCNSFHLAKIIVALIRMASKIERNEDGK